MIILQTYKKVTIQERFISIKNVKKTKTTERGANGGKVKVKNKRKAEARQESCTWKKINSKGEGLMHH